MRNEVCWEKPSLILNKLNLLWKSCDQRKSLL